MYFYRFVSNETQNVFRIVLKWFKIALKPGKSFGSKFNLRELELFQVILKYVFRLIDLNRIFNPNDLDLIQIHQTEVWD